MIALNRNPNSHHHQNDRLLAMNYDNFKQTMRGLPINDPVSHLVAADTDETVPADDGDKYDSCMAVASSLDWLGR